MILSTFLPGFIFSFLGSIPPGSINLSVIELSLKNHFRAALRFSLAAAIVEIPYAFIAVEFADLLSSTPEIAKNMELWGAIILIILGLISLLTSKPTAAKVDGFQKSGFRRGVLISVLNPLAIPFWIGLTAYLQAMQWLDITTMNLKLVYILGISFGTFSLLYLLALIAKKASEALAELWWIRKIPGTVLLFLGLYALGIYFSLL